MKTLFKLTFLTFIFSISAATSAQVLFNNFLSKFETGSVPFLLDENYMVHQLENPTSFENVDPIFLEFIFDDRTKDKIFNNCGGYDNLDSCFVVSFISKLNINPNFHSLVYSERSNLTNEQEVKYFLSTFSKEGKLISTIELASLSYERGNNVLKEGYVFDLDNIFSITKSYSVPSKVTSLGKMDFKLNSKGRLSDPVIISKAIQRSSTEDGSIESRP